MFTGIVQGTGKIIHIENHDSFKTLHVELPPDLLDNLKIGASIANDGCCLTVTSIQSPQVTFDVIAETLEKTTLKSKKIGDLMNIERSLVLGSEIGGHLMSGHIFGEGKIIHIEKRDQCADFTLQVPAAMTPYLLHKGFVGIDGASLTIGDVDHDRFNLHLIPETLAITHFDAKKVGDFVNIEVDAQTQAIVDTVERYLKTKSNLN